MFKFPWAVSGERCDGERAGAREAKWVQEEKAARSAQGQGHLEKNVCHVPVVPHTPRVHMVPHRVSRHTQRKNIVEVKCAFGIWKRWCSWGVRDSWVLLTRAHSVTCGLSVCQEAAGSRRVGLRLPAGQHT